MTSTQTIATRRCEGPPPGAAQGGLCGRVFCPRSARLPSAAVKDQSEPPVLEELLAIFAAAPGRGLPHNLADKHDTHVAVALHSIAALRRCHAARPKRVYGCEVWRGSGLAARHPQDRSRLRAPKPRRRAGGRVRFANRGGKRYDLATAAAPRQRHLFHLTQRDAHPLTFAMDLTPLIEDVNLDVAAFVRGFIQRFEREVVAGIANLN